MKRFNFVFAAAIAATLLLSACDITVTPVGPPTPDFSESAGTNPSVPVWTGSVPREGVIFRLDVPASVSDNYDVVYLELDQNLQLELRHPNTYTMVASSSSPQFFATGTSGLVSSSADLGTQAIGVNTSCRGSCIILPGPSARTFYARVVNNTGATVTSVNLYFYGDDEQDTSEPNDSMATATFFDVFSSGGEQGAIELLGDADFYRVNAANNVTFSTATGNYVDLRVVVLNASGVVVNGPIAAGTLNVLPGDYLKVYSNSGRAGAPAASNYSLLGAP